MASAKELFPLVSVDIALFSVDLGALRVLLVRRAVEPQKHRWALPGAVLNPDRDADLESTARRALREKLKLEIACLEQVSTFSGPHRDERGWSIAVLFYALLPRDQLEAVVGNKIEALEWFDARAPGHDLAFDHGLQLDCAVQVLRDKVARHGLPVHLLPTRFTLTELQNTCEAILGHALDKSVFRRRLKSSVDLLELGGEFVTGPQRPAQLFCAREGYVF